MATGTVKWFDDARGYGLIAPDDGSEGLSAHFSAINMPGFKSLKQNQKVQVDVIQRQKPSRSRTSRQAKRRNIAIGRLPGERAFGWGLPDKHRNIH